MTLERQTPDREIDQDQTRERGIHFEAGQIPTDEPLDLSGLTCPEPFLRTKLALRKMDSGDELTILATDPGFAFDFKAYCGHSGDEILDSTRDDKTFVLRVRKA